MTALIIRIPERKRERLKDLARARKQSVTKLFDEMATVLLAEYDAETRFRTRAARGAGKAKRGLQLLAKARGEARAPAAYQASAKFRGSDRRPGDAARHSQRILRSRFAGKRAPG